MCSFACACLCRTKFVTITFVKFRFDLVMFKCCVRFVKLCVKLPFTIFVTFCMYLVLDTVSLSRVAQTLHLAIGSPYSSPPAGFCEFPVLRPRPAIVSACSS